MNPSEAPSRPLFRPEALAEFQGPYRVDHPLLLVPAHRGWLLLGLMAFGLGLGLLLWMEGSRGDLLHGSRRQESGDPKIPGPGRGS